VRPWRAPVVDVVPEATVFAEPYGLCYAPPLNRHLSGYPYPARRVDDVRSGRAFLVDAPNAWNSDVEL
jgi:hypothetical protein